MFTPYYHKKTPLLVLKGGLFLHSHAWLPYGMQIGHNWVPVVVSLVIAISTVTARNFLFVGIRT